MKFETKFDIGDEVIYNIRHYVVEDIAVVLHECDEGVPIINYGLRGRADGGRATVEEEFIRKYTDKLWAEIQEAKKILWIR